jgi:hypothetical protein
MKPPLRLRRPPRFDRAGERFGRWHILGRIERGAIANRRVRPAHTLDATLRDLDQSRLEDIEVEVFMQTPLDFLNRFRVELRTSGIRFAITSGMACVHYGLQQTTKDSDWIVPPDQVDMLRGLFVRHEASPPPWTVRYRSIFGAPLESEWIAGGWTSHLSVRTEGGGPDHHVDFFGRPPRVRHWNADPSDPDFADRDTVTRMKKTDRDRDWPIVGGLAAQSFARNDSHAVLHLQAVEPLRRAWAATPTGAREAASTARPLLAAIDRTADDDRLEFLVRAERIVWEAVNRGRYGLYQTAWKAFYRRWQRAEDCPWPKSMPFAEQHALVVTAARRHDLPPTPLTPAARVAIYQAGLARAAVLANLEPNEIAKLAPPIEEMLP